MAGGLAPNGSIRVAVFTGMRFCEWRRPGVATGSAARGLKSVPASASRSGAEIGGSEQFIEKRVIPQLMAEVAAEQGTAFETLLTASAKALQLTPSAGRPLSRGDRCFDEDTAQPAGEDFPGDRGDDRPMLFGCTVTRMRA